MRIIDCDQGSPEWFASRTGVPSASKFSDIVTGTGEASKSRTKYLYQLAGEKVSGSKEESYQSAAMTRGIEMEGEARSMFELMQDTDVKQVGFCLEDGGRWGCSPDGLILEDGGLEIKCPSLAVHVEYLLKGKVPSTYYQQVQGSMFVTGRDYWWFMSYYPNMKPLLVRAVPDVAFRVKLREELERFSADLNELVEKIR